MANTADNTTKKEFWTLQRCGIYVMMLAIFGQWVVEWLTGTPVPDLDANFTKGVLHMMAVVLFALDAAAEKSRFSYIFMGVSFIAGILFFLFVFLTARA